MKQVVVIQEADVIALGEIERAVGRRADAGVGGELDPHARARAAQVFEHLLRLPVLRAIVDDAPLPIGERLVEKTERGFGQPFRLRVVGRGDQTEERFLLLRDRPGVPREDGLETLESFVSRQRPQSWDLLSCCVLSRQRVGLRFLIGIRPFFSLQLMFEKRLPVRSLFDRFEPNRGRARRHANFDRETAVTGERKIAKRAGQVRPFQTVTRKAPFASDLGPHPRDLFPAAGKAPAFDEEDFAARFPLGWQIERKGEIAIAWAGALIFESD